MTSREAIAILDRGTPTIMENGNSYSEYISPEQKREAILQLMKYDTIADIESLRDGLATMIQERQK